MESISAVLYSLYRDTPAHDDWVVACLKGAWANLLGERLAESCRPNTFGKNELLIEILDRSWEEALRSMKEELETRLRESTAGEVRRVRFTHPRS